MAVFNPVPAQARAGIARLGLDRVLDALTAATEEFVASEQAFRNVARKNIIGVAPTDLEAQAESGHNELGIQHLNRALTEIANLANVDQGDKANFNNALASADGRQALANARTALAERLAAQDLAPADLQELLNRWDTEAGQMRDFDSMVSALQQRTTEVRDVRGQPNRGRESASPLPLWKIILIASTMVLSLGAVVACFWWSACVWIMAYLAWYAPSVAATINMGC